MSMAAALSASKNCSRASLLRPVISLSTAPSSSSSTSTGSPWKPRLPMICIPSVLLSQDIALPNLELPTAFATFPPHLVPLRASPARPKALRIPSPLNSVKFSITSSAAYLTISESSSINLPLSSICSFFSAIWLYVVGARAVKVTALAPDFARNLALPFVNLISFEPPLNHFDRAVASLTTLDPEEATCAAVPAPGANAFNAIS